MVVTGECSTTACEDLLYFQKAVRGTKPDKTHTHKRYWEADAYAQLGFAHISRTQIHAGNGAGRRVHAPAALFFFQLVRFFLLKPWQGQHKKATQPLIAAAKTTARGSAGSRKTSENSQPSYNGRAHP